MVLLSIFWKTPKCILSLETDYYRKYLHQDHIDPVCRVILASNRSLFPSSDKERYSDLNIKEEIRKQDVNSIAGCNDLGPNMVSKSIILALNYFTVFLNKEIFGPEVKMRQGIVVPKQKVHCSVYVAANCLRLP